jgi:hypothetical protein
VTSMADISQGAVPVETIKKQLAQTFGIVCSSSSLRRSDTERQEDAQADPRGALCRNF